MPSETYILNLQLQLTGAIEQALSSVQDTLKPVINQAKQLKDVLGGISTTPLEKVATGASRFATSMSLTNQELSRAQFSMRQLSDVDWSAMSIDKIDDAVAQYEQLGEIQQFLAQQTAITRVEQDLLRKIGAQRETFSRKFRNTTKQIGDFIKQESILIEKILKDEKSMEKLGKDEMKRLDKKVKQIEIMERLGYAMNGLDSDRVKSLSTSFATGKMLNAQYHKSRAVLKSMAESVQRLGGGDQLAKSIENFSLMRVATLALTKAFTALLNTQEAFRASTFRVAGSIQGLVRDVNVLQASLGVTGKQAIETVTALAKIGASKEDIKDFAEVNAMFAVATRGSAEAAGLMQRRLKLAGSTAKEANKALARLTVQSARFGLTSTDVNNVLNTVNSTMFEARAIYGMSGDAAVKYSKALIDLAAAAKSAGADVQSVMSTFTSVMQDPLEHIILLGENFDAFQNAKTPEEQMALLGKSAKEALAGLSEMEPAMAKLMSKALYKVPIGKLQEMADSADEFAKVSSLGGKELDKAAEVFDKSFGTILGELGRFASTVLGVIKIALTPFIGVLTKIAKTLGWVATQISDFVTFMTKAMKESPKLTTALEYLAGALVGLYVIKKIIPWTKGLFGIFGKGIGVLSGATKKITGVASSMTGMGKAAQSGGAAQSGLKQFAQGLKSFFNALTSISWTTIAKVAVLLGIMTLAVVGLAAAAKYLGSEGVVPLLAITAAMIGMSVALYILTPALAALAVAGTAAIPIIAVLALAVSGVALAIGYATKMMLEGLSALAPFSGSIMELSMAGIMALAAAPGFVALALGLGVLSTAMGAFGLMSFLFGSSVDKVIAPMIALGQSMQGVSFEPFARLLDTIDRINISKVRKVAEAIGGAARASAAASALGIIRTRAETIATVKTTGETGRSMEKDRRDREELDSIKSLVNKLDDIMARMGDPAVTKIFEILAEHLPKMSDKESGGDFGLSKSNSWG